MSSCEFYVQTFLSHRTFSTVVINFLSFSGLGKVVINDVEQALPFCTHLVYGWAQVDFTSNKVVAGNPSLDLDSGKGNFRLVTTLKRRYPHTKFLLGIGGQPYDKDRTEQYYGVIENSGPRLSVINSAYELVKTYDFDGVNIAWEFPPTKPKKIRSSLGSFWHGVKKTFGGSKPVDEKADEHKEAFTSLTRDFKNAFKLDNYVVAATVLPNVNASRESDKFDLTYKNYIPNILLFVVVDYYDVSVIMNYLDFVVLGSFDFYTPERNPKEADFAAPLYPLSERNPDLNVDSQVTYWLNNRAPATKVVVGIPTFGRAWELDSESGLTGVPPLNVMTKSSKISFNLTYLLFIVIKG